MDVKELAEELSNFVNSGDSRKLEKLAELMIQDHRTLQQLKMKLACLFIEKMAAQEFHDTRNEASVKTARAMIAGYKSHAKEEVNLSMRRGFHRWDYQRYNDDGDQRVPHERIIMSR
jgi:hypothetical protein